MESEAPSATDNDTVTGFGIILIPFALLERSAGLQPNFGTAINYIS